MERVKPLDLVELLGFEIAVRERRHPQIGERMP
jgi:hypothetical protein